MISKEKFDELLERAREEALKAPPDAYAPIFSSVLHALVENERGDYWWNRTATEAQMMEAGSTSEGRGW